MPLVEMNGPATLPLNHAILIYGRESGDVFATSHDVDEGVIQPGKPIDLAALMQMVGTTKQAPSNKFMWVTDRLVAESPSRRAWWTPAGYRDVFIAKAPRRAWFPSLFWIGGRAHRSLYLYACGGIDLPPVPSTILRKLPMSNIHPDDSVCLGDMNPGDYSPFAWQTAFFNTSFATTKGLPTKPYHASNLHPAGTIQEVLRRLETQGGSSD